MRTFLFSFLTYFLFPVALLAQSVPADSIRRQQDSLAAAQLAAASGFFASGKADKALVALSKSSSIYQKTKNKTGQVRVLLAYGSYYDRNGLWKDSERYYRSAYATTGKSDSTELPATVAARLGEALFWQGKYEQALTHYQAALNYFGDKGLKNRMAECYVQIARIKHRQKNYAQAESLILNHALGLFRSADNEYGRISCFDILGRLYHKQKKYSQAKWFFIQANTQSRKMRDTTGIITSLVELSKVKADIRDFDLALRDLKEAQGLAKRKKILSLTADVNEAFAIVYEKSGNKTVSNRYRRAYESLYDSMDGLQNDRELAARKAESESEKVIRASEQPAKPRAATAEKSSVSIYYFSAFAVLIILAALAIYFWRRNRRKQ